jgi:RES domain-containing protein
VTTTAWRVTAAKFADRAFSGEGARLAGGRWNSPGRRVVYTSATTSLALLETLVHADLALHPHYVAIPVSFDSALVTRPPRDDLPATWRALPIPVEVQRIGDDWLESGRSSVLEVPSVIVPHESNFILDPTHPDFESVAIGQPIRLDTDPRLA